MFPFLIIGLIFVFAGLLAHFVAEQRGRPAQEPWIVTAMAAFLAMGCVALLGLPAFADLLGPIPAAPLFVALLAPLPPLLMFLFAKRGDALLAAHSAPCPHCEGPFVVDRQFLGQSVLCPHCGKPFQLPAAKSA